LVTASDRTPRTNTIAVAASGTVDYRSAVGDVPASSTVRLTSDRSFWGFALHDHLSPANDWGYSWLASDFLTRNYTVSFAPGVNDPATSSTPAQRTALPPDPQCTIPPPGAGTCDSIDRSPVFVAASLDGTFVKVDFDNDGIFDLVDTNSDDYPDNGVANDGTCGLPAPPWNVPGATTNCLYRIDALQVLRVYDYTDYDNTGTRIQATKPISVAYGQDTDQATGPDPILDTGYTVYPLAQRFQAHHLRLHFPDFDRHGRQALLHGLAIFCSFGLLRRNQQLLHYRHLQAAELEQNEIAEQPAHCHK